MKIISVLIVMSAIILTSCSEGGENLVKKTDCMKIIDVLDKIDPDLVDSNYLVQNEFKRLWINLEDEKLIETTRNIAEVNLNDSISNQENIFSNNLTAIVSYCEEYFESNIDK